MTDNRADPALTRCELCAETPVVGVVRTLDEDVHLCSQCLADGVDLGLIQEAGR